MTAPAAASDDDPQVLLGARVSTSLRTRAWHTAASRGQTLDAWLADLLAAATAPLGDPATGTPGSTTGRPGADDELPALLTTAQVAKLLRIDPYTVRRYIGRGELVGTRVGREFRIPRAALDRWLHP